jgi:hypothetical protein
MLNIHALPSSNALIIQVSQRFLARFLSTIPKPLLSAYPAVEKARLSFRSINPRCAR